MQYGQIVFLLFVAMVFYYAAMIFMDFQRAKAAQNAEQDSHKEEDIDISEEARSFRPIRMNLNPKNKVQNRVIRKIPNQIMKVIILTVQRNLHPNQNLPDTFIGRPS